MNIQKRKSVLGLIVFSLWLALAKNAVADDVAIHAVALFNDKAMLSINGGKAKIIKNGETLSGVTLISASTKEAVVEVNGQREILTLNSAITLAGSVSGQQQPSGDEGVQLWADDLGFFRSTGSINGQQMEFLVDTGANLVVLSSSLANRLGIEYRNGQRGTATTASGLASMYIIEAREVRFDKIVLNSITTGVVEGDYPLVPLLGMSFLERVDMNRSGNMMVLKKRF